MAMPTQLAAPHDPASTGPAAARPATASVPCDRARAGSGLCVNEIRERFLRYFAAQGHERVASSSLVPHDDPTLLFTNAGMNQFKDVFLGFDTRPYRRAVTSQKCVRAGGKHNDLENVGYTARHHTFFEMLGNFSFGDYFKQDAIRFAWTFLTSAQWLNLPPDRLMVTVYASDDEAYAIWRDGIGIPEAKIIRIGDNKGAPYASDNFWTMGDTGPCGPCSEIFYDHGPTIPGGPPGSPGEDGDRFIEIWNLVFMQFNRDVSGQLHPLPHPSVDTGMGLERLSAVLQGVHANYEIDLFVALMRAAAGQLEVPFDPANPSLRVLADHIRASAFLIADGVQPGNEGRGYVLRRIVRRAIRHGYKLFQKKPVQEGRLTLPQTVPQARVQAAARAPQPSAGDEASAETGEERGRLVPPSASAPSFLHALVPALIDQMGEAYPELSARQEEIASTLRQEEEQFARTLDNGMKLLEAALEPMTWAPNRHASAAPASATLAGEVVFRLYDTFGFPVDLTADICRERGVVIDLDGFEREMAAQRQRAREAGKFEAAVRVDYRGNDTQFHGYTQLGLEARVQALYHEEIPVSQLNPGEGGLVILDHTPFYAEGGGQIGDQGELVAIGGADASFRISDTRKLRSGVWGHHGVLEQGCLRVSDRVMATVDAGLRHATARNHSATHLLHAALRETLGRHVAQKGSLVDAERLRFDFSHPRPLGAEQIAQIETWVNQVVLANHPVTATLMPNARAIKPVEQGGAGALALFGEKYGEEVRVLRMGAEGPAEHACSTELCGGTHVTRTGDIGFFKIISESGIAAGVRRIEALTGENALRWVQRIDGTLRAVAEQVQTQPDAVLEKLARLRDERRALEKTLAQTRHQLAAQSSLALIERAEARAGFHLLIAQVEEGDSLREQVEALKSRLVAQEKEAVVVLASAQAGRVSLAVGISAGLTQKFKAGELVSRLAQQVGGKGGGRPDFAMAGGTQPDRLPAALAQLRQSL